jgi:hypothetical protein
MNLSFLKNKTVLLVLSVSVALLILVIVFSPKKTSNPELSIPTDNQAPRTELVDLSKEKRQKAASYTSSIEKKLPLYLANFPTSVDISTSINLYRLKDDDPEIVRLEIYGLSYLNKESDPVKNPNVIAFKESYLKAIEMLESQNIDPKKLIFIYGDKEYVRTTSQIWIDSLKLTP